MLLISPFLLMLPFSHSLSPQSITFAQIIRDALLPILLGQFISLLIAGILMQFSHQDSGTQTKALPVWPPVEEQ